MFLVDAVGLKSYYMDKNSSNERIRVVDTDDWVVTDTDCYNLALLFMQNRDLPVLNVTYTETDRNLMTGSAYNNTLAIDQKKMNYYKKRNYPIQEITQNNYRTGNPYTTYLAKVPTLHFTILHHSLLGWWRNANFIDLKDALIWKSDGMKVRGQSKSHLMIWYKEQLFIIDAGILETRGQIFYRDKNNSMWLQKVIKDYDGIAKGDYYFYISFIEKIDGVLTFTLSGFDRHTGDWYQTKFNLDDIEGIPCNKGFIISKMLAAGGKDNMYTVTGFKNN